MTPQSQQRRRAAERAGRPRAPPAGRAEPTSLAIIAARHADGRWHVMAQGSGTKMAEHMIAPNSLIARALDQLAATVP